MTVLILGDPRVTAIIKRLKDNAHANPIKLEELRRLIDEGKAVGEVYPESCAQLPGGFRVCYTIEEHPEGWCKHISLSVAREGRWPHPAAAALLIAEFGMSAELCAIYNEEETRAVNFIQPVDVIEIGDIG